MGIIIVISIIVVIAAIAFLAYKNTQESQNIGIWLRHPSSGIASNYRAGLNYEDSIKYCVEKGGRIATKEEVMSAGAGIAYCEPGLYAGPISGWFEGPDNGFYSDGTNVPKCGKAGWNTIPDVQPTDRMGTYCYGVIPTTPEVVAWHKNNT